MSRLQSLLNTALSYLIHGNKMKIFHLQVIATLSCFLCGALANYSVLTMSLDPTRYMLANIVGIGCLPLGLFMGYTAFKERKSQEGN